MRTIKAIILFFTLVNYSVAQTIDIGVIASLSGPGSFLGVEAVNAMNIAIEELNANEPIKYRVIFEDSISNPAQGISAFRSLESRHKPVVYICLLSSVCSALSAVVEQNAVPLMSIISTAPSITVNRRWVFRYFPTAVDEIKPMAVYISKQKYTQIGLLHLEDEFGASIREQLEIAAKTKGFNLVSEGYLPDEQDFRMQLLRLKGAQIDALYLNGMTTHLGAILKRISDLGIDIPIMSSTPVSDPALRKQYQGYLKNVVFSSPGLFYDNDYQAAAVFKKKYKERYGSEPSYYAAVGYDSILLLVSRIKSAGEQSRAKLRNELETNGESVSGASGTIAMDLPRHEFSFPIRLAKIKLGEIEYLGE